MRLLLTALFLSFSFLCLVGQEEKIYSFHSEIEIVESGSVTVQEKIRIYATGNHSSVVSHVHCLSPEEMLRTILYM